MATTTLTTENLLLSSPVTSKERLTASKSLPTPPETDDNDSEGNSRDIASSPSPVSFAQEDEVDIPLPPKSERPKEVLQIDQATPDNWLPRDPRLIRLTGVHPFNVEAPLSALYDEGFLTSPELFYVRNHGAVPKVEDDETLDWEFCIEGLVQFPLRLKLRDLLDQFEQVTVPITLVCAGNRRKEQNVVRKTKGFSWGAAGCSTALWTGWPLAEVIRRAVPKRGARFVCMEGADMLPNGYYGTSLKLNWVMDPNRGIMLAHMMNGEPLTPDHGKPLRIVVPGQIGGRSVKWLKRLIITDNPSDNWYHIYDNRVLPTMISPEESAQSPKMWEDERSAIYDLNPNSAIVYPAHDEVLDLKGAPSTYTAKGYAYSGGGRRISRVEISLDQGSSWKLASVSYPEDKYRVYAGKVLYGGRLDSEWREACFCWCFWSISIEVNDLKSAKDIFVRAMDESMNVQPRDMYWSVLGMMNNPWFRVCIMRENEALRFEHPTQPALQPGGWMERVKKAGGNLTNGRWGERLADDEETTADAEPAKEIIMTKPEVDRIISLEELSAHDNEETPWFVLNGQVYDGTKFLKEHPGGAASITATAGRDATDEFMAIHSETAKAMMPSYHIGSLTPSSIAALNSPDTPTVESDVLRPTFLDPRSWKATNLVQKVRVSWDTRLLTFSLEHESQWFGLPTGQHVMARLRDKDNTLLIRPYTPVSHTSARGIVELLVKVYFDSEAGVPGGRMSQALDRLESGAILELKGPIGKFEYIGRGKYQLSGSEKAATDFLMLAGGSGITPIWQVLRAILEDPEDSTRCVVVDCNRKEEDILCRNEMERLVRGQEHKCTLIHTLTKPPEGWKGERGRVNKALLKKAAGHLRDGQRKPMALVCGPAAMEKSLNQILKEMGWTDDEIVFF